MKTFSRNYRSKGFALVVTLSLMILLTVVAVGLLSLSSISMRASGQSINMATARANARMALLLAVGDLQKNAGLDTRVTARADILAENNPPVMGVWKSWEGANHEQTGTFAGRPISPGNYQTQKESRFLSWLTSSNVEDPAALPDTKAGAGRVKVLGEGSIGTGAKSADSQIHLQPVQVTTGRGRGGLAWWVSGENQKARLPKPYQAEMSGSEGKWASQAKSHSVADPKPFRMESLLDDATPADKAVTLQQSDLIATTAAEKVSREFYHDLSAVSVGLLTNTATGGWRKDMSSLTENWNTQPSSGMPLFRLSPGVDRLTSRATTGNPLASGSMLYPWAAYRGSVSDGPIYVHGPVASWENLVNYATFYKSVPSNGLAKIMSRSAPIFGNKSSQDSFEFLHKVRVLPVIARMQWVFSHYAGTPQPPATSGLEPRLLLTPVITMWNPYNVEITTPQLNFSVNNPIPVALKYTITGVQNLQYNSIMDGASNYAGLHYFNGNNAISSKVVKYRIQGSLTLKPGETRVFSPQSTTPVRYDTEIALGADYRSGGGHYFPVMGGNPSRPLALASSTDMHADAKFNVSHNQGESGGQPFIGVGIDLDMFVNGSQHLAYRMIFDPMVADEIYPPMPGLSNGTLGQVATKPKPFLSTMFGARMASKTHQSAKGFVQSSPLVNYTAMGKKDEREHTIKRPYKGTKHPVNSPFDYSFVTHTGGVGDTWLPNSSGGAGRIVTGFTANDGLSRCIIGELPTRPLASLGELVNWDLRYENPIPPYAINLIGNSDATPLVGMNTVLGSYSDAVNLQYDDSYCANHLLFDDWFVSSIAPDGNSFGPAGRDRKTVFFDFVSGKMPLPNRAYQPLADDMAAATTSAGTNKLYNDEVNKAASWKTIASRLEVEGMFNVNSTSVPAWRALLGHARRQKIPVYGANGVPQLSSESDHAVTRFSVAGDGEAGTSSISGSFAAANALVGYRTLDEDFLEVLAEKVVDQVRKRGPFLSLSEFVNRQLSNSEDLALAGAIQTALNEAAKQDNIFAEIEDPKVTTPSFAKPVRWQEAGYQFEKAAEGYSAYGLPGWTRQADILRPLAPILSARDDTFTIRAYGDARDSQGKIIASAVCEAVVRRTREFVDLTDLANITTLPKMAVNLTFGRRFAVVSYRWLNPSEI